MPSLSEQKRIVTSFLRHCNDYAEKQIAKYQSQNKDSDAYQALAVQDKIVHWSAYKAFNQHAIDELDCGQLDDWFD